MAGFQYSRLEEPISAGIQEKQRSTTAHIKGALLCGQTASQQPMLMVARQKISAKSQ